MKTPATAAVKLLSNKWFWIILIVLILAAVLYKNGPRWWQQLRSRDRGNYQGQDSVESNPARKAELEQLARDAFRVMDGSILFGTITVEERQTVLTKVLALNDTELRWIADFYTQVSGGRTLKSDVDGEDMPMSEVDEQLTAKLNQLNL